MSRYGSKRLSIAHSINNLILSWKKRTCPPIKSSEGFPASLEALPTEILLQIFVHIPYWDLKLRLPLVNKRFNTILKVHGQEGNVSGTELYRTVFKDAPLRRNYVEGTGSLYQLIPMPSCSDTESTEYYLGFEPTYTPHPVFDLLTFKVGWKPNGDLVVITYLGKGIPPLMAFTTNVDSVFQLVEGYPPGILMENAVSPAVPVVNITPAVNREGRKPKWDGSCIPLVEGSRRIDREDGYNREVHLRRAVTVLDVIQFIWTRPELIWGCSKGTIFDLTLRSTMSDGVLRLDPFIANAKYNLNGERVTEEERWIRSGVILSQRRASKKSTLNITKWLDTFH